MAKKAKKAKTNSRSTTDAKPKRGRPRNQDLPGLEDRGIKALDDIAAEYADVRDRRMELNQEEHDLKANALILMRKHGKTIYKHEGVTIQIIESEADVKVKVAKPGEDKTAESEGEGGAEVEAAEGSGA